MASLYEMYTLFYVFLMDSNILHITIYRCTLFWVLHWDQWWFFFQWARIDSVLLVNYKHDFSNYVILSLVSSTSVGHVDWQILRVAVLLPKLWSLSYENCLTVCYKHQMLMLIYNLGQEILKCKLQNSSKWTGRSHTA